VYFGYTGLSRFTFLALGFWVVMVAGIAFALVYGVGSTRGKRAARMWTDSCVAFSVLGAAGVIAWAWVTGELPAFLATYGFDPLGEMAVLAVLFLSTMWFMAIRYTEGLKQ